MKYALNASIIIALTVLSQIGGLAWLLALNFRYRFTVFLASYTALACASLWVAPVFGRVPFPCGTDGPLQMQSWLYCILNRQYVAPELLDTARGLAGHMERTFPGTVTLGLDGNFPFFDNFPLLPHLSHDDGEKLDIALYYRDERTYLPGATRSPIGYFAFEQGPTECPPRLLTLRWDLDWLQPVMSDLKPEPERNAEAVRWLAADARVQRIFIEPHLRLALGVESPKLRFQGCRAARHDDHIHFEL